MVINSVGYPQTRLKPGIFLRAEKSSDRTGGYILTAYIMDGNKKTSLMWNDGKASHMRWRLYKAASYEDVENVIMMIASAANLVAVLTEKSVIEGESATWKLEKVPKK